MAHESGIHRAEAVGPHNLQPRLDPRFTSWRSRVEPLWLARQCMTDALEGGPSLLLTLVVCLSIGCCGPPPPMPVYRSPFWSGLFEYSIQHLKRRPPSHALCHWIGPFQSFFVHFKPQSIRFLSPSPVRELVRIVDAQPSTFAFYVFAFSEYSSCRQRMPATPSIHPCARVCVHICT